MTCFDCCKEIQQYPCACGYEPKGPTGQRWLIQHCTTAGCQSAIRMGIGSQEAHPVCKWCVATALYGDPYSLYDTTRARAVQAEVARHVA